MKKTLTIFLTSLILLVGCNGKNSQSGETPAQKADKEQLERVAAMAKTLDNLQSNIDTLENDFGVVIKHHPNAKSRIEADLTNLMALRFDPNELMEKSEEDLTMRLRSVLENIGNLSSSFVGKGGWTTKGYENKEEFFKHLSSWSIFFLRSDTNQTAKEWLSATRNFFHACKDKFNLEQYALVSILRSENEMESADCLTLFETLRDSTHLEISIPDNTGSLSLVALRGMPLETLTLSSTENSKVALNLEGIERAQGLRELVIKNVKVVDLSKIANLKEMDTLVIEYPGLKRQLKNCPVKTANLALNRFCQNLGF